MQSTSGYIMPRRRLLASAFATVSFYFGLLSGLQAYAQTPVQPIRMADVEVYGTILDVSEAQLQAMIAYFIEYEDLVSKSSILQMQSHTNENRRPILDTRDLISAYRNKKRLYESLQVKLRRYDDMFFTAMMQISSSVQLDRLAQIRSLRSRSQSQHALKYSRGTPRPFIELDRLYYSTIGTVDNIEVGELLSYGSRIERIIVELDRYAIDLKIDVYECLLIKHHVELIHEVPHDLLDQVWKQYGAKGVELLGRLDALNRERAFAWCESMSTKDALQFMRSYGKAVYSEAVSIWNVLLDVQTLLSAVSYDKESAELHGGLATSIRHIVFDGELKKLLQEIEQEHPRTYPVYGNVDSSRELMMRIHQVKEGMRVAIRESLKNASGEDIALLKLLLDQNEKAIIKGYQIRQDESPNKLTERITTRSGRHSIGYLLLDVRQLRSLIRRINLEHGDGELMQLAIEDYFADTKLIIEDWESDVINKTELSSILQALSLDLFDSIEALIQREYMYIVDLARDDYHKQILVEDRATAQGVVKNDIGAYALYSNMLSNDALSLVEETLHGHYVRVQKLLTERMALARQKLPDEGKGGESDQRDNNRAVRFRERDVHRAIADECIQTCESIMVESGIEDLDVRYYRTVLPHLYSAPDTLMVELDTAISDARESKELLDKLLALKADYEDERELMDSKLIPIAISSPSWWKNAKGLWVPRGDMRDVDKFVSWSERRSDLIMRVKTQLGIIQRVANQESVDPK